MYVKYCKAEHRDLTVNDGKILLGTIWGYQDMERGRLGDPYEGVRHFALQADPDADFVLRNDETNAFLQSPEVVKLKRPFHLTVPAGEKCDISSRQRPTAFGQHGQKDCG